MKDFVNRFVAGSDSANDGLALPPVAVWGNLAIFAAAWALLMWPDQLPLGRPSIAMVFAALACGLRAICSLAWPEQHYPTVDVFSKIDTTPIALLFGLMLVNAYLKDTGAWRHLEVLLDSKSPHRFLVKICLCSSLLSAVLLNDTTCFVLTPIVLAICAKRHAKSSVPYLLALSMSSNIGSSLTVIGNPQNALIASISPGITFMSFMRAMLLPVVAGLVLNTIALLIWSRKDLVFMESVDGDRALETSSFESVDPEDSSTIETTFSRCSWAIYVASVAVVALGMVVGWVVGLATDDVALAAGTTLMLVRAVRRRCTGLTSSSTETEFALGAIDYSILILFAGQFVLVGTTVDTGLPQRAFRGVLGDCAEHLGASPGCVAGFSSIVLVLSNLIGNVPVILMLQPLLASQPSATVVQVWLLCAWVATAAGNLTMMGSAANLIVAHSAECHGERGFTATCMGKFSVLPTLAVTAAGVLLMPLMPVGATA